MIAIQMQLMMRFCTFADPVFGCDGPIDTDGDGVAD